MVVSFILELVFLALVEEDGLDGYDGRVLYGTSEARMSVLEDAEGYPRAFWVALAHAGR